jgi:ribosomal protein S18 acetylase RimI-like enzyme
MVMEQFAFAGVWQDPTIRPMTMDDIPQVARLFGELVVELHLETGDPYLTFAAFPLLEVELSLEEDLRNPEARVLVAEVDGTLVGMAIGHVVDVFLSFSRVGRVGQITAAYVDPSYRGREVMAELEQRLIEFFREEGLHYIELHVLSANETGRAVWRALGYSTFREQMRKRI